MKKGFSLIEILVVITVFVVLAVIITQILANSLKSSRKSEAMTRVRTNLNYALEIIDRHLRNADSVVLTTGCGLRVDYLDSRKNPAFFECKPEGGGYYIASGSGALSQRLTSNAVNLTSCSITCEELDNKPDRVNISVIGKDTALSGVEGTEVSVQTQILLRNY